MNNHAKKSPPPNLTIIIPVHNERLCIEKTIKDIRRVLKLKYTIIVVDDYSTDNTFDLVKKLESEIEEIKAVSNSYERGFGNALKTGFKCVKEGVVVSVMADSSDEIEGIEMMYTKIMEGYDIVCGARHGNINNILTVKEIISHLINLFMHFFISIPTTDVTNAFKMYRRELLDKFNIESKSFEISMEIVVKAHFAGYKVAQIPTVRKKRISGKSKFHTIKDGKNYFKWILFSLRKLLHK